MKDWLVVIPARLESTRLAEKPLQDLGGAPLIIRVRENLEPLERKGARIIIATDSQKIIDVCDKWGYEIELTSKNCLSGTDRCNEVAIAYSNPYILNVQGDEPFINCNDLMKMMKNFEKSHAEMATLVYKDVDEDNFDSPDVVKVVKSIGDQALYFSRSPIPYSRQPEDQTYFYHHIGVYAFEKETLAKFCQLEPGELEQLEKLEQLRALENGIGIHLTTVEHSSAGIDTKEELEGARAKFEKG